MGKKNSDEIKLAKLEKSVNSLQWFHTIIISLAVVQAVGRIFVYNTQNSELNFTLEYLHNFIVFLFIVIPFHHGANRYLDETYVSKEFNLHPLTGMIDFLFFFFEGLIFYVMAMLITNNHDFYTAIIVLLVIDIFWLSFVFFSNKKLFNTIKPWFILNLITAPIIYGLIILNILDEVRKYYLVAAILIIRTILDYCLSWPFYWPIYGIDKTKDNTIAE